MNINLYDLAVTQTISPAEWKEIYNAIVFQKDIGVGKRLLQDKLRKVNLPDAEDPKVLEDWCRKRQVELFGPSVANNR